MRSVGLSCLMLCAAGALLAEQPVDKAYTDEIRK